VPRAPVNVPRAFVDLARDAIQHRSDERFALLYRLLWRLTHGERDLLDVLVDPLGRRVEAMAKAVRRDAHTLKAFLRFRELETELGAHLLAWAEPDHLIVEATAPFFAHRFARTSWSILTPDRSAHWTGGRLHFAPGVSKVSVPTEDALEAHWRKACAGIFRPARVGPPALHAIPLLYRHVPSGTSLIRAMDVPARRAAGIPPASRPGSAAKDQPDVPGSSPLDALREQAMRCRACPLYEAATRAVFGEGPQTARLMLVGEQPGDQEDLAGRPFVGPAGQILDRALAEAGLERTQIYVTNAVKHFKFTPRGKRRIHQKPDRQEISACRSWLDHEIAIVKPKLIIALGASAARALLGRTIAVGASRGHLFSLPSSIPVAVTVHPSYILRIPDRERGAEEYARLVADLRAADAHIAQSDPAMPMAANAG
jgi:DNA polymerase